MTDKMTHAQKFLLPKKTLPEWQPDITSLTTITYVRVIPELVEKSSRELLDEVLKEVSSFRAGRYRKDRFGVTLQNSRSL